MTLAVCAVLWSNPATAEMLCAATPGCPHHAPTLRQSSPSPALPIIASLTACCPAHSPLKAPVDPPACCAATETGAVVTPSSCCPGDKGSRRVLAAGPAALFSIASEYSPLSLNSKQAVPYVQPVDQKKTDLRI